MEKITLANSGKVYRWNLTHLAVYRKEDDDTGNVSYAVMYPTLRTRVEGGKAVHYTKLNQMYFACVDGTRSAEDMQARLDAYAEKHGMIELGHEDNEYIQRKVWIAIYDALTVRQIEAHKWAICKIGHEGKEETFTPDTCPETYYSTAKAAFDAVTTYTVECLGHVYDRSCAVESVLDEVREDHRIEKVDSEALYAYITNYLLHDWAILENLEEIERLVKEFMTTYRGTWDSRAEFAQDIMEPDVKDIPSIIADHINWDDVASDLTDTYTFIETDDSRIAVFDNFDN